MTELEILELAYEGANARHAAATKEYIRAVVNAVPGSSTGEAAKIYWMATSQKISRSIQELGGLIEKAKAAAGN